MAGWSRSAHVVVVVVASAACAAPPSPPIVVASAPIVRAIASCALAAPSRTPVKLRFAAWLGRLGDRSWVIGATGGAYQLAALADDGTLAITPLPVKDHASLVYAIDGARLWLLGDNAAPRAAYAIDLTTAHPTVATVDHVVDPALPDISSFAVGATRALFYTATVGSVRQWDRAAHRELGAAPFATLDLAPPQAHCSVTACFMLGVVGDGPTRRLAVVRLDPATGHADTAQLADDHLMSFASIRDGDRTDVVWTSGARDGVFARSLDGRGQPATDIARLASAARWDVQLIAAPDRPRVAYRDARGWSLGTLSADRGHLDAARSLGLPQTFLAAAVTTDGVLAVGFTTDVSIDSPVPPTVASAVFVSRAGVVESPIDVTFGERQPSDVPLPLVAPGYAAVLRITEDDITMVPASDGEGGELAMLRTPCAAAPP